jgi:hypothetical protein
MLGYDREGKMHITDRTSRRPGSLYNDFAKTTEERICFHFNVNGVTVPGMRRANRLRLR